MDAEKRRDLYGHTVLCPNRKTYSSLRLLSLRFQDFWELLTRFELPTSSLPTAVEPSSPCCTRLFGGFLSKKDEVTACLFHCFRPHVSPCGSRCGSKLLSGRERGAHLRQRQAEPHQMPVWFCSYPYKTSSRRESSKIAYRRFCQKRSSKLKLSHSYFSFQKRTAVIKEYADTLAF